MAACLSVYKAGLSVREPGGCVSFCPAGHLERWYLADSAEHTVVLSRNHIRTFFLRNMTVLLVSSGPCWICNRGIIGFVTDHFQNFLASTVTSVAFLRVSVARKLLLAELGRTGVCLLKGCGALCCRGPC